MKRFVSRTLLFLGIGFLLTLGSLLHSSTDIIHTSYWRPTVPTWTSDYEVVSTWGFPLGIVIDNPYGGLSKRMDRGDDIDSGRLMANYVCWCILLIVSYTTAEGVYRLSHRSSRRVQ